jgi:DNA-binding NtrC family response regulator
MTTTPTAKETEKNTKTIVVIEDDDGIAAFIVEAIRLETPYQIIRFADGYEAWNLMLYQNLLPDLLILDYNLPLMTGIKLYDHIHARKEFAYIPALVISAHLNVCKEAAKERHLACLEKPFELNDLLDMIEKLIV